MTTHARDVLADCERALADFEGALGTQFWRTRWVALVALLRAVGHVLDKVDKPAGTPELQRAIEAAWQSMPPIFVEFIEDERNNVLKAYAFAAGHNTTVRLGDPSAPATYNYFMRSGSFADRDPVELCREAIAFWKGYLDAIDREAARPRSQAAVI